MSVIMKTPESQPAATVTPIATALGQELTIDNHCAKLRRVSILYLIRHLGNS